MHSHYHRFSWRRFSCTIVVSRARSASSGSSFSSAATSHGSSFGASKCLIIPCPTVPTPSSWWATARLQLLLSSICLRCTLTGSAKAARDSPSKTSSSTSAADRSLSLSLRSNQSHLEIHSSLRVLSTWLSSSYLLRRCSLTPSSLFSLRSTKEINQRWRRCPSLKTSILSQLWVKVCSTTTQISVTRTLVQNKNERVKRKNAKD